MLKKGVERAADATAVNADVIQAVDRRRRCYRVCAERVKGL